MNWGVTHCGGACICFCFSFTQSYPCFSQEGCSGFDHAFISFCVSPRRESISSHLASQESSSAASRSSLSFAPVLGGVTGIAGPRFSPGLGESALHNHALHNHASHTHAFASLQLQCPNGPTTLLAKHTSNASGTLQGKHAWFFAVTQQASASYLAMSPQWFRCSAWLCMC